MKRMLSRLKSDRIGKGATMTNGRRTGAWSGYSVQSSCGCNYYGHDFGHPVTTPYQNKERWGIAGRNPLPNDIGNQAMRGLLLSRC